MKATYALTFIITVFLAACGGGSTGTSTETPVVPQDDPENPNLPTGLPVETPDASESEVTQGGPLITPDNMAPPNSLDSTTEEWRLLIDVPTYSVGACFPLMKAMSDNRGVLYSSVGVGSPQSRWYWTQGYVVTFSWNDVVGCQAEDYSFEPTDWSAPDVEPELTPISDAPSEIAPPVFDPPEPAPDTATDADPVEFTFVEYTETFGSPAVRMRVTNNQAGLRVYNVSCDVQALDGSTIVDSGFAYFAGGSTISGGESAEDVATFFTINSFDDFETIRWECDWLLR